MLLAPAQTFLENFISFTASNDEVSAGSWAVYSVDSTPLQHRLRADIHFLYDSMKKYLRDKRSFVAATPTFSHQTVDTDKPQREDPTCKKKRFTRHK